VAFLPGEILFGYLAELDDKARTISKTSLPDLENYDEGRNGAYLTKRQAIAAIDWVDRWREGNARFDYPAGGQVGGRIGCVDCDDGAELTLTPPAGVPTEPHT
jgi:hypothetical protein